MKKGSYLLIVQPLIASYRKDFFDELSTHFDEVDIYSNINVDNGFKKNVQGKFNSIHTPIIGKRGKIYYQAGIISAIIKNRPAAIYITADFRAIHYFLILLIAKILRIPIFPHGQGLYNKPNPSLIHRFLFKTTISLSSQYICYTKSTYDSLINIGINPKKLSIIDNTIVNNYPIKPNERQNLKNKIIYIGRLREGSNLELLFDALKILKNEGLELSLDIIGDGEKRAIYDEYVKKLSIDAKFYGAVYDDKKISDISRESKCGVYPGDAGLSVVHYMSLSLVPIVHNDLTKHMGPEPSYIIDNINGITFNRNDANSLAIAIKKVITNDKIYKKISYNAYETYKKLSNPSMAEKFIDIIKPYVKVKV